MRSNGISCKFLLGHAGFRDGGAYPAASITTVLGPHVLPWFGKAQAACGIPLLFLLALVTGGLCAGLAGFLVGVPSLRLKGDYLAIVTLGFGEIIRVIFQNIQAVGVASGFKGILSCTTFFLTLRWAARTGYVLPRRRP